MFIIFPVSSFYRGIAKQVINQNIKTVDNLSTENIKSIM